MKYFSVKLLEWSFQLQNMGVAISFHFFSSLFYLFPKWKVEGSNNLLSLFYFWKNRFLPILFFSFYRTKVLDLELSQSVLTKPGLDDWMNERNLKHDLKCAILTQWQSMLNPHVPAYVMIQGRFLGPRKYLHNRNPSYWRSLYGINS